MRNKLQGLTRLEVAKLLGVKPLPLSEVIAVLNKPQPSRLQVELVIKSLKYHACQHILNFEMNRPTVSHSDYCWLRDLVMTASYRFGIDIYKEYKAEVAQKCSRNLETEVQGKFKSPHCGVQSQYTYTVY